MDPQPIDTTLAERARHESRLDGPTADRDDCRGRRGWGGADGGRRLPDRLPAALAADTLRTRPRRQLLVRFAVTTAARAQVSITGTTTRPLGAATIVRPGRATLRLRAPRRPGRYRITLSVDASDGRYACD